MHKYLSAIGFSSLKNRKDFEKLVQLCAVEATERAYTSNGDDTMFTQFNKEFAPGLGLTVCGEYDENNSFLYDYAYPYMKGSGISTTEDLSVERHADKESYAGVCDDINIGVTLIFFLQNIIPYIRAKNTATLPVRGTSLTLSALSVKGSIMMPIMKDEKRISKASKNKINRTRLMEAARNGNEDAMESLTLDDMDMYTTLTKRIQTEDVYTIVETSFMPYGVECDQYSILGEIVSSELVTNYLTNENIWKMTISCNELVFDLCINEKDLFGEPEVGRRFKGVIWLQGFINFPQ